MNKLILLLFTLSFALFAQSQISKTVNVTAGGLSAALTSTELTTVTNLTVTGTIDARDFVTMRNAATALTVINLSGANIVAYTGTLGTSGTSSTFYSANTISVKAFVGCTGLTSIIIPMSVISIGDYAFYSCTGLKTITLPSSVTSIGVYAFSYCSSLTSISIPSTVTSIGDHVFNGCLSNYFNR